MGRQKIPNDPPPSGSHKKLTVWEKQNKGSEVFGDKVGINQRVTRGEDNGK